MFLKSERVAKVVQAGGFSANDFREVLNGIKEKLFWHLFLQVFRCNVERRIRSLPEIDGLSKDTVDSVIHRKEEKHLCSAGACFMDGQIRSDYEAGR